MGGTCVVSAEGIATLQSLCQEVGCPYHDELCSTTCCVALVVLWMGLHQEKFPLLATSLQAATGVGGRQKWALILQMCLIWRNFTKRLLTSVLSQMEWTHKLWNGMARVIQMMRYLELTYPAG